MTPIAEVSDLDLAFPADVTLLMPRYDDIPEEFRNGSSKWNRLFADWFFSGLEKLDASPKDGVDVKKALRHIRAIMGSFQPSHEHKEAAVAFLLSEWLEDANWTAKRRAS